MAKNTELMTRETLAGIEAAHVAAEQEVGRLRTLVRGEVGQWITRREQQRSLTRAGIQTVEVERPVYETRQPDRAEILAARRALHGAEERLLDLEADLEAARRAFDQDQRAARVEYATQADKEAARELRELVRETDRVAALWQRFAEASQRRDEAHFATAPRNGFEVARYIGMVFPPLTDLPGEPSQWSAFRARVTEAR